MSVCLQPESCPRTRRVLFFTNMRKRHVSTARSQSLREEGTFFPKNMGKRFVSTARNSSLGKGVPLFPKTGNMGVSTASPCARRVLLFPKVGERGVSTARSQSLSEEGTLFFLKKGKRVVSTARNSSLGKGGTPFSQNQKNGCVYSQEAVPGPRGCHARNQSLG